MNKKGPIIIVEDDKDDQLLLEEAFKELAYENEVIFFDNGIDAFEYLKAVSVQPFLILSDINLPKLNGFELREIVHNNEQLRLKCIPYLFFSTSAEQTYVIEAYSKSVQGFFTKPVTYGEILRVLRNIVEYWRDCHSPHIIL